MSSCAWSWLSRTASMSNSPPVSSVLNKATNTSWSGSMVFKVVTSSWIVIVVSFTSALRSRLDLHLAGLERGCQRLPIALLNGTGQRVLLRGALDPAEHRAAGGEPLAAHLAAGQLSFLKEIIHRIQGDGREMSPVR